MLHTIKRKYLRYSFYAIGILCWVVLLVLFFNHIRSTNKNATVETAANRQLESQNQKRLTESLTAVKQSITAISPNGLSMKAGLLLEGTAVLVGDHAAYWVKDGKVYAANGFAKMWSPQLEYAPVGIDISVVRKAIGAY